MQSLYYVMAILGCGDDGTACQQVRTETVRYESVAACQAAMAGALQRSTDVSFPVVQAACQRSGVMTADSTPRRRG
ncbi:hypothetical protein ASE86_01910 [Sphingomonas sp. Leaf33]|uniref:hypothetical protein n=1 Tax=Sphingomonas sp. Leaf33 TaxID=1736215 RepID=UPI0006FA8766|nr:hypothetical protein [Sphingomonas sp. Leaf33]KQN25046.1 hypothetical protein ASE86_01910 [Sphingomonas sp. Leaf33]